MKCVLLMFFLSIANGAKILTISNMPTASHYIIGSALSSGLTEKGHKVTFLTSFKSEKTIPGVREIYIDGVGQKLKDAMSVLKDPKNQGLLTTFKFFLTSNYTEEMNEIFIKSQEVQNLMKNEKFDLIIFSLIFNEWFAGLAHHFNAPFIVLSTTGSMMANHVTGNTAPYSYVPNLTSGNSDKMNFKERLINSVSNLFWQLTTVYKVSKQEALYEQYFPNAPNMYETIKNCSLVLVNGHVCLETPRPYLPNMIPIGGYHIKGPKKLPKDLQDYFDNAKNGVVYFSLGSNLKSADLDENKIKIIMDTFKNFPKQKFLWKFENESLPGIPENVRIEKWFPQSDLLAHPNMKIFISHGGLLSSTEAVYRGVPVIGVPFYGDQKGNTMLMVNSGYGIYVDFGELTEETFTNAIREILTNPKYTENVKKRSAIINDQPDKPLDRAVFWVEHILRHGGGQHLRAAAVDLNLAQYFILDVIAFILGVITVTVLIIYKACKCCCRRKKMSKQKTQ